MVFTHDHATINTMPALPACHAFPAMLWATGLSSRTTGHCAAHAIAGYTGQPRQANLRLILMGPSLVKIVPNRCSNFLLKFNQMGYMVKLWIKNSHQMGYMVKLWIKKSHQIGYMVKLWIKNAHKIRYIVKLLIKNSHQMVYMVKLLIKNSHQMGYMVKL